MALALRETQYVKEKKRAAQATQSSLNAGTRGAGSK
jgi:hypothetical protein